MTRKTGCVLAFFIATAIAVNYGYGTDPTCNGTAAGENTKCNGGTVPSNYFESVDCYPGPHPSGFVCLNAIAFNQAPFTCTGTSSNPTLCVDATSNAILCTRKRVCSGIVLNDGQVLCYQVGDPVETNAFVKSTWTTDGPVDRRCVVDSLPNP